MIDKLDRSGSEENEKAPRQIEESNAAPGPDEAEISSVDADDSVSAHDAPVVSGGSDKEDPWFEVMRDFARLVVGAFEADPHRFDFD